MLKKLLSKAINKFISVFDTASVTDSLSLVLRSQNNKIKAIRNVSDEHELAVNFNGNKIEEQYVIKQDKRRLNSKQEQEIQVVNRFLPVFNSKNSSQFVLSQNQPPIDSHIDVLITETKTKQEMGLQVRVSDDQPWGKLYRNKIFERLGVGFKIHHKAIKRAIEDKKKYPLQLRDNLILLLDGWLSVRPEDLEYFINTEKEFMQKSGFKEIWFVGGLTETIVRLH